MKNIAIKHGGFSVQGIAYTSLVLVGLMSALPFLYPFHYAPLTGFYSEWLAFALGLGACLAFLGRDAWANFSIPKTAIYWLAFLILLALQGLWITRPYAAQSLIPGLYLSWAIVLMLVGVRLRQILGQDSAVTILAWFMSIGGLLQAFTGLVQYLGYGGWIGSFVTFKVTTAVHGNIAQTNHFATHIMLAVVGFGHLFAQRRLSAGLVFPLLLFLSFVIALSGSRAILLYAFSLCVLSFSAWIKERNEANYRYCLVSAFFLLIFPLAQPLLELINPWLTHELSWISLNTAPFTHNSTFERLPEAPSGIVSRTTEWLKAWYIFLQAPIFGVGMGNYGWHSFNLQSSPGFAVFEKPDLFSHSHNVFSQVIAETGIAGFLLLTAMLIGWIHHFRKQWLKPGSWFIAAVLLVLFIHSNLEYPLWYSYFLGIAALLLAIGDHRTIKIEISPTRGRVGAGILLILAVAILGDTFAGYGKITALAAPYSTATPDQRTNKLVSIARNPILTPYAELILARIPTTPNYAKNGLVLSTRAFHYNPDSYKTYTHAVFLALNNQMDEAKSLLRIAARAYPNALQLFIDQHRNTRQEEIKILLVEAKQLAHTLETAPAPAGNLR